MISKFLPTGSEWQDRFIIRWALAYVAFLLVAGVVFINVLSSGGDVGVWQTAVSWIVFASVIFGLVAANRYFKRGGADERGREHLRAIRPQLINATPAKLTIERGESLGEYRDAVAGLFDGERPTQTTVRDALGEFRAVWNAQTRRFPALAVNLAYEAVLILIFGAVVILPVSWWSGSETTGVDLEAIGSALWTLITAFPALDVIFALALTAILSVGGVLFDQWLVIALVLFTGAYLIARLDRETEEDLAVTLYPDRWQLVRRGVLYLAVIYLAGALGALISIWLGLALVAIAVGIIVARVTLEFLTRLRDASVQVGKGSSPPLPLVQRLEDTFEGTGTDPHDAAQVLKTRLDQTHPKWDQPADRKVMAYLLVRKVWGFIGLACLPILLAYIGLAFGSGAILAVGSELATAPDHIRLPALAIVLLAGYLVRQQYPELTDALIEGLKRASASSSVRAKAFSRGVPLLAVFIGFAATWPLFGAQAALVAGLFAGVLARFGTFAWQMTAYRFVDFAERDAGHPRVVIEGFTVSDADGEDLFVARVDGQSMAHRDREALVEIVLSVARRRLEDGELPPTFAGYYYDELTRSGDVDISHVADEYRADIKTRVTATLREHDGSLEVETMDAEMTEEYAEPAYRGALRWLKNHGDLDVRRGEYVLH
ncbi:hypothetical protein ACLI4U_19040 (plasmid) [Natrialbaceae archaeon A-CW2]